MFRKIFLQEIKTLYVQNFFFVDHLVYEVLWKNIVERGRSQMIVRSMCISCWIPKARNTHSQYVTLIAFPQQQGLQERASILRYTYVACLLLRCSEK